MEEQAPGVFIKTLRNMWVAVAFFNPVLSTLSLLVLPLSDIYDNQGALLARMGQVTGGDFLRIWVAVDATMVLSGAVLTSFVGVTGLARRMAMDRCLPQFLLNENSCRKTNHWIIIGFFLVASSLFLILNGNVETLSGVYNLAFLCVMVSFPYHSPRVCPCGAYDLRLCTVLAVAVRHGLHDVEVEATAHPSRGAV